MQVDLHNNNAHVQRVSGFYEPPEQHQTVGAGSFEHAFFWLTFRKKTTVYASMRGAELVEVFLFFSSTVEFVWNQAEQEVLVRS